MNTTNNDNRVHIVKNISITFLGTGLMGAPMVKNLLSAGYRVTVWNRSTTKAAALVGDGAVLASTATEAVNNADIVFTMLSDGSAVSDLLFRQEVCAAIKPGATLIDMGSIKPAEARVHAEKLSAVGIKALDAPVSGGTRGAEAATLAIMVGGEQSVFDDAKSVLSAMGRPVRVGPVGAGQIAKLANQLIVAVTIGVVAEATLLVEQCGADATAMREALRGGFADSVILQQHGQRMSEENFEPGGFSRLQLKDLNNALEVADNVNLSLPLAEQVQDRFSRLVTDLGGAEKDHSALYLELKDRNGLS